ncbi:MAG: hypothetical protein ACE5E0_06665 [Terriglobia bacterium]
MRRMRRNGVSDRIRYAADTNVAHDGGAKFPQARCLKTMPPVFLGSLGSYALCKRIYS